MDLIRATARRGVRADPLYSTADVAVSLRLLRALGDVAATTPDPVFHRMLVERGRRIVAGCSGKLGEEELRDLRLRLAALEALAGAPPR
jgi:hypothetical protein